MRPGRGGQSNACSILDLMAGGSGKGHEHPIPATPPARQHCWVDGPDRRPHPGLVIAWEKRARAWFAQVIYLVEDEGVLVQQWLSAELLTRPDSPRGWPRPDSVVWPADRD